MQDLNIDKYELYTARDFAQDETFQQWVLSPDIKSNFFWDDWIRRHPQSKTAVSEAILLIRSVQFRSYDLKDAEKDKIWDGIWDTPDLEDEERSGATAPTSKKKIVRVWKYAAAVLLIVTGIAAIWQMTGNSSAGAVSFTAETRRAEIRRVLLPDSSEVILNANSEIVFSENDDVRDLWLKGEAYFHIRHTDNAKAFIVHTYDSLTVTVLGTRFNVNTSGMRVFVVLEQGSIEAAFSDSSANEKTKLYLKPGDMIEYDKENGDFSKSRVDPTRFVSWTENRLVMDHYTLQDAAAFIRKVFDRDLVLNDSTLLRESISGSMPIIYNLDTMLVQFSKAFQLQFYKDGNQIRIKE